MRKTVCTDNAPKAIGPYSQAVQIGDFVYTSGQIPLDPETGELVSGDIAAATARVLDNLAAVLAAAGCGLHDVVKTTVFLKDLGDFKAVNEVYAKYFSDDPPARSCVQAGKLPLDAVIEIEAIAFKVREDERR